jgi:hypothetical protein
MSLFPVVGCLVYTNEKKGEIRFTSYLSARASHKTTEIVTLVYSGRSSVHLSAYLRTEQIFMLYVVFFLETYTVIFRSNLIFVSIV